MWSTPMSILRNTEFKILRKKLGDEGFRVSFIFPRCGEVKGLPISIDFQA